MARGIPRVVHWLWLQGTDQVPDHLQELTRGFVDLNPNFSVQWWDEDRLMAEEVDLRAADEAYHDADRLVPRDSVMQMRADIARYAIVRQFGGVALDLDYLWQKPVDDLLKSTQVTLGEEVAGQWIACGFLAATPKHTLFTRLLDGIPENLEKLGGRGLRANSLTGTKYLTRTVRELGERKDIRQLEPEVLHPVPWDKPALADHPENYPDSYAVHQWSHQRGLKNPKSVWRTW